MEDDKKPKEREIDLHRQNKLCPTCKGIGTVKRIPTREDGIEDFVQCTSCNGSGYKVKPNRW